MPTYANGNLAETLFEGHEDRIQRLESDQQKLVSQSTEALTKIEHLAKQVESSHKELASTIRASFKDLGSKIEGSAASVKALDARLEVIEDDRAAASRRKDLLKKAILPVLAAAASVIATKFGEQFWMWLTQ